ELEFVKTEVTQEQLSNTFDEIANAIINDEIEENTSHLYIENLIDLNHELLINDVDSNLT
ncbi:14409_t:CDS:2, partial [Entrophospora sp. SA101]